MLLQFNEEYHGTGSKPSKYIRTQLFMMSWLGTRPTAGGKVTSGTTIGHERSTFMVQGSSFSIPGMLFGGRDQGEKHRKRCRLACRCNQSRSAHWALPAAAPANEQPDGGRHQRTGAVLPGVTVTATSPALIGHKRLSPNRTARSLRVDAAWHLSRSSSRGWRASRRASRPLSIRTDSDSDGEQLQVQSLQESVTVTADAVVDTQATVWAPR